MTTAGRRRRFCRLGRLIRRNVCRQLLTLLFRLLGRLTARRRWRFCRLGRLIRRNIGRRRFNLELRPLGDGANSAGRDAADARLKPVDQAVLLIEQFAGAFPVGVHVDPRLPSLVINVDLLMEAVEHEVAVLPHEPINDLLLLTVGLVDQRAQTAQVIIFWCSCTCSLACCRLASSASKLSRAAREARASNRCNHACWSGPVIVRR